MEKNNNIQPERDQFDISFGNIRVLRLIPDMMNDPEFRIELRRLALDFMQKRDIR